MARSTFRWIDKTPLVSIGNKGAKDAAEFIREQAKFRCPVDTGNLRRSIQMRQEASDRFTVAAYAPYAAYVEFGTIYMRAQPYLGPAVEMARRKYG